MGSATVFSSTLSSPQHFRGGLHKVIDTFLDMSRSNDSWATRPVSHRYGPLYLVGSHVLVPLCPELDQLSILRSLSALAC